VGVGTLGGCSLGTTIACGTEQIVVIFASYFVQKREVGGSGGSSRLYAS
jgi:hypothetical protein